MNKICLTRFSIGMILILLSINYGFAQITIEPPNNTKWYRDVDGDGLGNPNTLINSSTKPNGYVGNNLDCDDYNSNITIKKRWYKDADGDGYGNPSVFVFDCVGPNGYVSNYNDCNDSNPVLPKYYYRDADSDGYGNINYKTLGCSPPSGYVLNSMDCDDSNIAMPRTWYIDLDQDGFGKMPYVGCSIPPLNKRPKSVDGIVADFVNQGGDCNDENASLNPSTIWYLDADGDGFCDFNEKTVHQSRGWIYSNSKTTWRL